MKRIAITICIITITITAYAQQQGIGIRLGLPAGVTYKRYLSNEKAVEFGIGSAFKNSDKRYYKNAFKHMSRYDNYSYESVDVSSVVYLQGRLLFQHDLDVSDVEGKFQWYWGVGAVMKVAKVDYWYRDPNDNNIYLHDDRTDFDFGPEGIIGMEYTFEDVPVTLFAETSIQLELVDRLTLRLFAGTGARFNF
ncbi:hypothetical protein [Ohtaekwangia koreensis]|uniref:Outer membrane protein beta-barrel domain-containing protein n=1 Tax=Ohtaekwangia koreensis TaxID=688867 RepID=A0A1T5LK06_9BACT|nr:hypothetical protein [Ohtaekwangia koreensis]SKC76194.1 hypothetical protein SAMN05660236_3363 [Ohtaekwangia koreensis]